MLLSQPRVPHHRACGSAHGGSGRTIRVAPHRVDATRKSHPWYPMLPIRVLQTLHSPIRGHRGGLRPGGRVSAHRFSPSRHRVTPMRGTMASADFPGHFLPGISPDKNVLLPGTTAAFTSAIGPWGFAVLCQLTHRVGLVCGFYPSAHRFPLSFLPPLGYPRGVGFTWWFFHAFTCWSSHRGRAPRLHQAHAGRTQPNGTRLRVSRAAPLCGQPEAVHSRRSPQEKTNRHDGEHQRQKPRNSGGGGPRDRSSHHRRCSGLRRRSCRRGCSTCCSARRHADGTA